MGNWNTLYTMGYQGRALEELLARLASLGVDTVIDVRQNPVSRRRGFSKPMLEKRLLEYGIDYVDARQLGSPTEIRNRLSEDQDYESFFRAYSMYLDEQESILNQVYQCALEATCCLLCYERLAEDCHRSVIAQRLKERDDAGLRVVNI